MDALKKAYTVLSGEALSVTGFTDTKINGEIDVSSDGLLYTSINFDEGWSVYIDGVKVDKDNYKRIGDALLGVPIAAGHHTVAFKFFPQGMAIGIAITVTMLLILIVLLTLIRMKTFAFAPKLLSEEQAEQEALDAAPPAALFEDVRAEETVIYYGDPPAEPPRDDTPQDDVLPSE